MMVDYSPEEAFVDLVDILMDATIEGIGTDEAKGLMFLDLSNGLHLHFSLPIKVVEARPNETGGFDFHTALTFPPEGTLEE